MSSTILPRRLNNRFPLPPDIEAAFLEAVATNPRVRTITVRPGTNLQHVPLTNQHELAATLFVFEDGGEAVGKELGFEAGAVVLWDGEKVRARKVTIRPTDGYRFCTIPHVDPARPPMAVRLHRAMAAAFHGLPDRPGLLVRHRDDDVSSNTKDTIKYGTARENREDYIRNRRRSGKRTSIVRVKVTTTQRLRRKLGIKGGGLNQIADRLLRDYVKAA